MSTCRIQYNNAKRRKIKYIIYKCKCLTILYLLFLNKVSISSNKGILSVNMKYDQKFWGLLQWLTKLKYSEWSRLAQIDLNTKL